MTCPYITSLDRECGRETENEHCAFHAVLVELELEPCE